MKTNEKLQITVNLETCKNLKKKITILLLTAIRLDI